jgi:hypothetical protein
VGKIDVGLRDLAELSQRPHGDQRESESDASDLEQTVPLLPWLGESLMHPSHGGPLVCVRGAHDVDAEPHHLHDDARIVGPLIVVEPEHPLQLGVRGLTEHVGGNAIAGADQVRREGDVAEHADVAQVREREHEAVIAVGDGGGGRLGAAHRRGDDEFHGSITASTASWGTHVAGLPSVHSRVQFFWWWTKW